MSTVTKQPSVVYTSTRVPRPVGHRVDRLKIRADVVLDGKNDIRERIACALSAKTSAVAVDRYGYSRSRLTARCTGSWNGRRLFAKILLANPYPIPPRFTAPWEAPLDDAMPVRGASEQIETEWNMTLTMRTLSEGRSVPAPLGRSSSARTIVWEEAGGTSVLQALKWSRWQPSMAKAGARALFQAGTWLRNIHDASHQRMEVIDARDLVRTARGFTGQRESAVRHYERIASRILEASLQEMGGGGKFAVPVAFTHGDFCLSNLIWDNNGWRLGVVDFELSEYRPVYHDLFALIAVLRSKLLNPLIPKSVILSWEQSFWWGYGPTSPQVTTFVKGLASARVFYHHLARLLTRGEREGWIGGINARAYRTFLEGTIIAQRLDLPAAFVSSSHH